MLSKKWILLKKYWFVLRWIYPLLHKTGNFLSFNNTTLSTCRIFSTPLQTQHKKFQDRFRINLTKFGSAAPLHNFTTLTRGVVLDCQLYLGRPLCPHNNLVHSAPTMTSNPSLSLVLHTLWSWKLGCPR